MTQAPKRQRKAVADIVSLKKDGPPDLQTLVKAHRGYSNIPPEAWRRYDKALAAWQAMIRSGTHHYR